jgi:putative integral membrane protein (TIGR02587 family)
LARSENQVAITNAQYAVALSRAFAGAVIFSLPLLMTMEMWWLGFYLKPWSLIQFSLFNMVLLYGMSRVAGFEESHSAIDDVLDAFAAYAVAAITASILLWLIGAFRPEMIWREICGMIVIQAVPASFGAMIGAKLLGEGEDIEEQERWRETYPGQLFLMLAGALFLSFTVAPTEEIILIAFQMGPWHALVMMLLSMILLHALIYSVGFPGKSRRNGGLGTRLLHHTLPGYAIAFGASLYVLWTFERIEGLHIDQIAMAGVVLAFPASIGAGIARAVV